VDTAVLSGATYDYTVTTVKFCRRKRKLHRRRSKTFPGPGSGGGFGLARLVATVVSYVLGMVVLEAFVLALVGHKT